jgi:hypothetical protein
MALDRPLGNVQPSRDLAVPQVLTDRHEHLHLAR